MSDLDDSELVPSTTEEDCAELERVRAECATHRKLSGQANYLLARIVAAANLGAIGTGDFIESYNLPVGPIHKAIPFLQEQGIVVTTDGQILNGPEQAAAWVPTAAVGDHQEGR
jgi:hypothetical protein